MLPTLKSLSFCLTYDKINSPGNQAVISHAYRMHVTRQEIRRFHHMQSRMATLESLSFSLTYDKINSRSRSWKSGNLTFSVKSSKVNESGTGIATFLQSQTESEPASVNYQ
jgi:hypothetical protein